MIYIICDIIYLIYMIYLYVSSYVWYNYKIIRSSSFKKKYSEGIYIQIYIYKSVFQKIFWGNIYTDLYTYIYINLYLYENINSISLNYYHNNWLNYTQTHTHTLLDFNLYEHNPAIYNLKHLV